MYLFKVVCSYVDVFEFEDSFGLHKDYCWHREHVCIFTTRKLAQAYINSHPLASHDEGKMTIEPIHFVESNAPLGQSFWGVFHHKVFTLDGQQDNNFYDCICVCDSEECAKRLMNVVSNGMPSDDYSEQFDIQQVHIINADNFDPTNNYGYLSPYQKKNKANAVCSSCGHATAYVRDCSNAPIFENVYDENGVPIAIHTFRMEKCSRCGADVRCRHYTRFLDTE